MLRNCLRLCFALGVIGAIGCKSDPKTPAHWTKAIANAKRSRERARVVDELRESKLADASFLPALHASFTAEKNHEVKAAYARLLGDLRDHSSVDVLLGALEFGSVDGAAATQDKEIVVALEKIGDPKPVPELLRLLRAKDPYVRIEAMQALGQFRSTAAVEPLIEIVTDETAEPYLTKRAIQALGSIGDPRAVPALVKMMFKDRKGVSFYLESSFALFQIGRPAADALVSIAKSENVALTRWAKGAKVADSALYAKSAQVLGDLQDDRAQGALVNELAYKDEDPRVQLLVRMKAAEALGRLRAKGAVKAIANLVEEVEPTARQEYARALANIGGREALPALIKSAGIGSWDAREVSFATLAMLGDEREQAAFEKFEKVEERLTRKECQEDGGDECRALGNRVKKHLEVIAEHAKVLAAAEVCKEDITCWAKKLDDPNAEIRQRAALELGRSRGSQFAKGVFDRVRDPNLDVRSASIQAANWLIADSKDAAIVARAALSDIERQLAEERSRTEYVRVNEDLRRLAVQIQRSPQ